MPHFGREIIEELSTVIAHVIDGATHRPGSKHAVAQRSGITPQHLSRIANGHNMPTPATGRAIADALIAGGDLTPAAANAWFDLVREHAELTRRRMQRHRERFRDDPRHAVAELQQLDRAIHFERDPAVTARALSDGVAQGAIFLRVAPYLSNQMEVAHACLILHHVYNAVGLQVQSLHVAVHARQALEMSGPDDRRDGREQYDFVLVDAHRIEAVALHNLNLPRTAYARSKALEQLDSFRRYAAYWKPHIYRDRLNAIAELPRVAISEAEGLALQVHRIIDSGDHPLGMLVDSMIYESLAKVYIAREKPKKALHVLRIAQAQLNKSELAGALHRTLIVHSLADAAWHLGARDEWRTYIDEALQIARAAGLSDQIAKIHERYGAQLDA